MKKSILVVVIALLYSFLNANMLFAAANTWTQKSDFGGTAREMAIGFSIGSKGYIGTGKNASAYKDFWEYDPSTNTWTQKADFGGVERYHAVGFSIGSKGYIGTGSAADGNKKDFWEYDPSTNTWTQKADFGGAMRVSAVGFSIESKGYIGTGMDSSLSYLKDFWEYDPVLNTWTQKADFGGAVREYAVGFSIGSRGYLGTGSGKDVSSSYIQDFWEYEPIDTNAAQFTFTDQTGVDINTLVTSNTITVSGITAATPISIKGGKYSINGGSYTREIGTVTNGSTVTVQQTSMSMYSGTTNAILTIGEISDTFSVTTKASPVGENSGNCFIATAAFGSPLAGQVEILRQFRDSYLLKNALGQKFVGWYYRNGPVAANFIKDKPLVKAAVRVALYPLIGFSFLLISGYLPLVTVGLLLSTLLFIRFRPKKLIAK